MGPTDTSRDIQAAQDAAWRRMSPTQRLDLALAMSNDLRALTRAHIADHAVRHKNGEGGSLCRRLRT